MGGPGSGRYPHKKKGAGHRQGFAEHNDPANVDPGVNHRVIEFGKELLSWEEPDYADAGSMQERFMEYLDLCDRFKVRPMVSSMAQAFGMDRMVPWGLATDNEHYRNWKGVAPRSVKKKKKAYVFLQTNLEISLMEEQKNPVKWFFLAKNYFGYEDQTVKVSRVEVDQRELPSPEEVAQRYALAVGKTAGDLPGEVEVVEVLDGPEG